MNRLAALAASLCIAGPLSASISVDMDFGSLRDSSGTVIASTATLWALVYDQDGDGQLPGGLGVDGSLLAGDAASAYTAFAGQIIAPSTLISGDVILEVGEFNDPDGLALLGLNVTDFNSSGLVSGRNYGFYWFPGQTLASSTLPIGAFQIGGLNEVTNKSGAIGTVIPNDGANLTGGVLDTDFGGPGGLPTTRFIAIEAIPEPSAGLFALFGLALLRRRR